MSQRPAHCSYCGCMSGAGLTALRRRGAYGPAHSVKISLWFAQEQKVAQEAAKKESLHSKVLLNNSQAEVAALQTKVCPCICSSQHAFSRLSTMTCVFS